MLSYVYVFDFGDRVKVGLATNIKKRLGELERLSGTAAIQKFSIHGDYEVEQLPHWCLREYRTIGEYFNCSFDVAVTTVISVAENTSDYAKQKAEYEDEFKDRKRSEILAQKALEQERKKKFKEAELQRKLAEKQRIRKSQRLYSPRINTDGRHNACGEKVRIAREKSGLSQELLAAKVQLQGHTLTQKAISRIETGIRIVPDYEIPLLANALAADPLWLLGIELEDT